MSSVEGCSPFRKAGLMSSGRYVKARWTIS